jgi:hypothetical protein
MDMREFLPNVEVRTHVTYKILTPYEKFKVCGLILGMRTCTPDYTVEEKNFCLVLHDDTN